MSELKCELHPLPGNEAYSFCTRCRHIWKIKNGAPDCVLSPMDEVIFRRMGHANVPTKVVTPPESKPPKPLPPKAAAELAEAESHYTETIEPTLPQRVAHYASALRKWRAAGYPTRTDAEVAACLAKCEEPCPKWDAAKKRCKVCGCNVNASGFAVANKARMATEVCPLGRWPGCGIITPEDPTP